MFPLESFGTLPQKPVTGSYWFKKSQVYASYITSFYFLLDTYTDPLIYEYGFKFAEGREDGFFPFLDHRSPAFLYKTLEHALYAMVQAKGIPAPYHQTPVYPISFRIFETYGLSYIDSREERL